LGEELLTAEAPENARGLLALLVERLGQEALGAKLVCEGIDGTRHLAGECLAQGRKLVRLFLAVCVGAVVVAPLWRMLIDRGRVVDVVVGICGWMRKLWVARFVCGNVVIGERCLVAVLRRLGLR
jgi:hypothetical protein